MRGGLVTASSRQERPGTSPGVGAAGLGSQEPSQRGVGQKSSRSFLKPEAHT